MIYLNPKNVGSINRLTRYDFKNIINIDDFKEPLKGFKQYGDELWNVGNILKIDIESENKYNELSSHIAYVHFIDGSKLFLCSSIKYEKVMEYIRDFVEKVLGDE